MKEKGEDKMKKLGFGLMRLPVLNEDFGHPDLEAVKKMVDAFMAAGGTYFDTAYPYHNGASEVAFRETVVKRYPRNSFTIADKMPMFLIRSPEEMPQIFAEQQERCGVDYFDYYWLHALGEDSYRTTQKVKAFEFIAQKKAEGKIRHIGFSFHDSPELLEKILTEHPEAEYVQLQINYLDWEDTTIQARRCYEIAVAHGVEVIVMEPLKGGALANPPRVALDCLRAVNEKLPPAGWALRFAASLDRVLTVLSGMSNQTQMEENIAVMSKRETLTEAEKQAATLAANLIRENIAIPCTACRYCMADCPKRIAIADYFALYNDVKSLGAFPPSSHTYYENLTKSKGKASDCIQCGKCEKLCPQHLPIREYLRQVSATFDRE